MQPVSTTPASTVSTCGCVGPSRWQCPSCDPRRGGFLACSRRCLDAHGSRRHGVSGPDQPAARALAQLRDDNRAHESNWALYSGHRARLTKLLQAVQRGEGLCVLGAGNGDDLEVPTLARDFGEVHLVDLDPDALRRGLARVPVASRKRVVMHPEVDLCGLLASVDTWADDFPNPRRWRQMEARAIAEITARFDRTFDVVVSDCIVSQLCVPFYRMLAARPPEWEALMEAVGRIHLAVMAALLRPGGTGVLVADFPYTLGSDGGAVAAPTWDALEPEVRRRLTGGVMLLRKPQFLMSLTAASDLGCLIEAPRLTEPWTWTQAAGVSLAYGILFRRASEP